MFKNGLSDNKKETDLVILVSLYEISEKPQKYCREQINQKCQEPILQESVHKSCNQKADPSLKYTMKPCRILFIDMK